MYVFILLKTITFNDQAVSAKCMKFYEMDMFILLITLNDQAVDRMVLYLRLVHSIDYYSANEYPNEDEMPHRCGIMHARGTPPGPTAKLTQNDGKISKYFIFS